MSNNYTRNHLRSQYSKCDERIFDTYCQLTEEEQEEIDNMILLLIEKLPAFGAQSGLELLYKLGVFLAKGGRNVKCNRNRIVRTDSEATRPVAGRVLPEL